MQSSTGNLPARSEPTEEKLVGAIGFESVPPT
jgi:hypothetical protein